MAEVNKEKSESRLGALRKYAAAGRSAARLDALRKCASAGRSAARLDTLRKCAAAAPAATFGEAAKRIGAQHMQNLAGAESAVAKQTAGLKDTPGFSLQNFMNVLKARKAETVEGAKAIKQTAQYAGQQLKGTAATKYPRAYAYVKGFLGKVKPQAAAPAAK